MSQDIRSFFSVVHKSPSSSSSSKAKKEEKKNKKRMIVSSSDEEDEEKQVFKPQSKKQKSSPQKLKQKASVKLEDVFGGDPVQQKPQTLIKADTSKSKKNGKLWLESHSDDEFEATLGELDETQLETKKITPEKNAVLYDSKINSDKKKKNSEAYQKYLNRSGPKNHGSKFIPEGSPNCLLNKTFVITGVLDSLEREEAVALIHKCGGRVTSTVSKKTDYIILGDEPGASKLVKAEKLNTKQLNEDDLLNLIRKKSKKDPIHEENSKCSSDKSVNEDMVPSKKLKLDEDLKLINFEKKVTLLSPKKDKQKLKEDKVEKTSKEDQNKFHSALGKGKEIKKSPKEEIKQANKVKDLKQNLKEVKSKEPDADSGLGSSEGNSYSQEVITKTRESHESRLWVDKYKPTSTKQIIGQNGDKSNVKKLTYWLTNWFKSHEDVKKKPSVKRAPWAAGKDDGLTFKAALLSGPPGVGKTTTVHLLCKELGFDFVEFNASDTRSKRLLSEQVAELLSSKSITNFYKAGFGLTNSKNKHVLVMDEVDGMAGNEDRGGIQELIQLIKNSRIPVICMCNDRSHPKIRSLVNYCFDLRFQRPRVEQIKGAMLSICCRENFTIPGDAITELIASSNQDVRQVLHNLYLLATKNKGLTLEQAKIDAEKAKKSLKLGPWDVARQVFSASEQSKMSFREKEELFFQDYSIGPLFVQDTYIRVKPYAAKGDKLKTLKCLSKAADSLTWGDVVERTIRSNNAWTLLPVQAIYSSVVPGYEMSGQVCGQIQFPVWLGKNSKAGRIDRLLQELQVHMRLRISGSKLAVNLDYAQHLRDNILRPLLKNGLDGVSEALNVLKSYNLLREDLDSILEVCQWPGQSDVYSKIESKVKAALTRAYNKDNFMTPYSMLAIKKGKVSTDESLEGFDELAADEDRLEDHDDDEDDNIETDAMIKKGKPKAKVEPSTSKKKTGNPRKKN